MGMMLPSTERRAYRDPFADDAVADAVDSAWRAEVRRLEEGGEAILG